MSTHKNIDRICVAVLLFALLLTILFMNGEALGLEVIVNEEAESYSDSVWFTSNDLNGDWDSSSATVITLDGSSVTISGGGACAYDGGVVIRNGGTYVLSGSLEDGSVVVDAYASSKVFLLLDGVEVSCADDAALIVAQAEKVFLTLAEGSENSFSSGSDYTAEAVEDGRDGVIYAVDDLTINGSGSLTVSGGCKHGIVAKDELVIAGGTVRVSASGDGIRANDSLRICSASIEVTAGDEGLVCAKENAGLYVESGTLTIEAADDGISTTGDVNIAGGSLTIAAGDDGIHSDTGIAITGGNILISECYEGMEAVTIEISGGDITIYPSDDGLNANGGSGFGVMGGGMPGAAMEFAQPQNAGDGTAAAAPDGGSFDGSREMPSPDMNTYTETSDTGSTEATETWVHVSGGTITIINDSAQDADGIDSNGDILISGGVIRVSLCNSGTNSALDYGSESGGVCEISGGEIIACGSYSMAEGFSSGSTQCSVLYNVSDGAEAGTTVTLENSEGSVLLSYEVPCSFSSVNLSCPALQLDETYLLIIGENAEEITPNEVAASYGDAMSGMFGGNMNWGGMQHIDTFSGRRGGPHSDAEGEETDFSGEFPMPPENGEMPEPGQTGEPPEREGMGPTPGTGQMGGPEAGPNQIQPNTETETAAAQTAETYSREDRVRISVSVFVLAVGLTFAAFYKRRRI
ncbi:MAG: carbohydrate-binding domain-containing protein [Oscillospiraceae bacterium]|nr:carbohydrate-binding domain-containing protein [Oscillospiraceae bacterium]